MRYLAIILLFISVSGFGQVVRTAGIAIGTAVPTHTPSAQGALKYYRTTTGVTYKYYSGAWVVESSGSGDDNQGLDTFAIVSNVLRISVEDDGVPFYSVDLSPYLDDTQLTEEQVEDYAGGMVTGNTETLITVTYQDADGTIDFEVQPNLSNYTNDAGFLTSEVDGSVSNELQDLTVGGTGPTYIIEISNGADITVEAGGIIALSEPTANTIKLIGTEVDGSVTNEIQYVDTLALSGTTLGISLYQDGQGQKTVDLSALQDGTGTDDQIIDTFDIASNQLRISLEDDDVPAETVDLSPYLDNTDTQDLSIDSAGNWYTVSLVNGGSVNIAKDTDTQLSEEQVEDFVGGMLSGNTETLISVDYQDADGTIDFVVEDDLSLYDNTTSGFISAEVDGSTTNEIQTIDTFAIVSNVLRASLLNDGVPFEDVDLSPYLDDTDTDDQGLTIGGSGPTYTIDIDGGADVTIAASGITTLSEGTANVLTFTTTEVDGSTTNEIQDLSLTGNTLALTSDASTVDLSGYLDNTDDQGLTVTGSGPDYIINQEDGTDITVSAAGIATLSEPSANELRITATEVDGSTTNEIQDFSVTDDGTTFDFDLSGTASDFALVEGTGITLSRTGNDVTIESTGGADDQGLTITGSGPTYVVDIEDGTDVTIEAAGINTLSEGTANVLTITGTEVDGSVTNEIQDITLSGTTTVTFDLSSDATDATITGAGIAAISRSGNDITVTATEVDGSTTNEIQTIDTFTIVSNVLRASLLNDGVPFEDVDLSPYLDNTDAQTFSGSDDGTTFTLDLSGAATDIAFKEGSNVTITRTGTELTFASTGSADNWGTDVVNHDGTLSNTGTVASPLKVDTTVISTKDFVYKGKVTQESSETIKTSNFTAVKTVIHPVDCSAGAITVTPPSSPAIGDRFAIVDSEAQAATNNITIDFTTGSYKLYTAIQNYIINVDGGYVEFIYMGTTTGWIATKG